MSLVSMFSQEDAACLLTDGGTWDEGGALISIGSKVATFSDYNLAIAYSGFGVTPGKIWAAVEAGGYTNTRDILRNLPGLLKELVTAYPCPRGPNCTLSIITYDPQPGPACWVISAGGPNMPPTYVPFTLAHVRGSIDVGDPSAILGRSVDVSRRASFDPVADGRKLADFARLQPWEYPNGSKRYFVGGFAELTTVGPAGLRRQTLREWPEDRLGELTRPARG